MAGDAKFSVILPSANFSTEQIKAFEETAKKYSLPVSLPLRADAAGSLIVSAGMTLRDAQMLRRNVSSCGYPADVISDAMLAQTSGDSSVLDPLGSLAIDMSKIDLGLSDGADIDGTVEEYRGENWLRPDDTGQRTLSVDTEAILDEFADEDAAQDVPLLKAAEKQAEVAKQKAAAKKSLNTMLSDPEVVDAFSFDPPKEDEKVTAVHEEKSEKPAAPAVDTSPAPAAEEKLELKPADPGLAEDDDSEAKLKPLPLKDEVDVPVQDKPLDVKGTPRSSKTPQNELIVQTPVLELAPCDTEIYWPRNMMLGTLVAIGICLVLAIILLITAPVGGLGFLVTPL